MSCGHLCLGRSDWSYFWPMHSNLFALLAQSSLVSQLGTPRTRASQGICGMSRHMTSLCSPRRSTGSFQTGLDAVRAYSRTVCPLCLAGNASMMFLTTRHFRPRRPRCQPLPQHVEYSASGQIAKVRHSAHLFTITSEFDAYSSVSSTLNSGFDPERMYLVDVHAVQRYGGTTNRGEGTSTRAPLGIWQSCFGMLLRV